MKEVLFSMNSSEPLSLAGGRRAGLALFFVMALLWGMLRIPVSGFAEQDARGIEALTQKAQRAYVGGRYAEAAAVDTEIAKRYPDSDAAGYAVQMLGTLYEENIIDIEKAIKWDREFMEKYASSRQVPFYKEKLASLEKLLRQEKAFRTYQKIRFAGQGDKIMVKKFEALLKEHPDFILKDKVIEDLGYAYSRMDRRRKSYLAFQALSRQEGKKISQTDRAAYETSSRYWEETTAWGRVAWAVVAVLWCLVLLMNPWKQIDRRSVRNFLILAFLWIMLSAVRIPTYYSINTGGDPIVIPASTVYIWAGLNLTVLLWLMLLTKGKFWQTSPRVLLWLSPVLTLLMTTAVFYLLIIHQTNGPQIIDVFASQYGLWATTWLHP